MNERSRTAAGRRSDPSTFLGDIDAAVNVLAAKEQGVEAGPPIPEDYEALTQEQIKEAQQEREEYDPTALLQTLQKQGVTPPVAPKLKPPGGALPEPNVDKSGGVASLTPAVPTIGSPSETDIASLVDPILKKSGLDNLQTRENVRKQRMDAANTAFDRSGAKIKKEDQLTKQQTLNKERLDPKKLKLDAILRGLMGASGGGNFAAVGTAGMNELDKQELAKQDALNKSLGIENELMGIDLEIGKFGITQAGEAEKLLAAKQEAAATIVSTFTTQELQTHLAEAKMELEANLGNVRTEMERLQIESLDKFRKASTREDKRKILSEMKLELLDLKDAARAADTKYTDLKDAAEKEGWFGGRDDEAIREFEEYARVFEFKWIDKENTLGITNLEEEISLGDSGGSGSQGGFSIKRQ
jgi:hypothetical protein